MNADSPDIELAYEFLNELDAIAERYIAEGLDPTAMMTGLVAITIKVACADPETKDDNLQYFAAKVRSATDVTVV